MKRYPVFLMLALALFVCCFQSWNFAQEEAAQKPAPVQQRAVPTPRVGVKKAAQPRDTTAVTSLEKLERPSLVVQGAALVLMSTLPFMVMILSSFVKIVVVLSLLRNALGVQQAPPNQVINGIAFLLSIYVMFPTGVKMYDATKEMVQSRDVPKELVSADSAEYIIALAAKARERCGSF